MGTGPLPVEPYISAEFFEKEREKIFRRAWLEAARTEELPNAGDYVVREIEVLKTSILLVRGKAGRSEEHTSDLQSLMRTSYAVFCLKQKTDTKSGHIAG